MTLNDIGLSAPSSWLQTIAFATGWCALMLAFSPVADWAATALVRRPPNLSAFRALQQSPWKLAAGIVVAWVLGALIEEIALRGVVLNFVRSQLTPVSGLLPATAAAVLAAASAALVLHLYQGLRAALIVTQLSILFGVLYVLTGPNLWAVVLCHGFYDTIAFVRFATKASKYSNLD